MKNLIGYDAVWGLNAIDKSNIKHCTDSSLLKKHRMKESYAEAIIPLGDEPLLRNRYINFQILLSVKLILIFWKCINFNFNSKIKELLEGDGTLKDYLIAGIPLILAALSIAALNPLALAIIAAVFALIIKVGFQAYCEIA